MHLQSFFWALLALVHITEVHAHVTVYSQVPFREFTKTVSAALANYTDHAMYDPTNLSPPTNPPLPSTQFSLTLAATSAAQGGLSQAVPGTFWGFSVEMSVADQVFGKNSSFLQVPFLNLMSLLKARGGGVHIRVGGNTQETATMIPAGTSLPNGTILEKGPINTVVATQTPALFISPELMYMMSNISSLLGDTLKWYLGVPMNDTNNPRLQIAEYGEEILGDNLLGLQVGNEPDLYGGHGLGGRTIAYAPPNYITEFGQMMTAINNDPKITVKNKIIGPSVTGGAKEWSTYEIFSLGYLQTYASNLGFISVEKYPDNNCAALFPTSTNFGPIINPQDALANYTTHASGLELVADFANASISAQQAKLPLLMFETNTASCGGFPGISDTYASALWGLDYGLTMAAGGFSGALLHVSGSTVYYNPFTPPPTNQSTYRQWTVSPIFYASLIMAEILGPTNTAQVVDLQANTGSNSTPAFGIYENGKPARVALFNYLTDPSGASTYTASIGISGSVSQVSVKYLTADSITQKTNISWAGQNFGGVFESDGRLQGNLSIQTVACSNNVCQIQVPAPGFALVSFIDTAFTETTSAPAIATYSTTTTTGWQFTNTGLRVDPTVLATSNGHNAAALLVGGRTSHDASVMGAAGLSTKTIAIIAGSVGGVVLLMVLGCCWCCCRRRISGKYAKLDEPAPMAGAEVHHDYVPYNATRYETAWDEVHRDEAFRISTATAYSPNRSATVFDANDNRSSTAFDANQSSTAINANRLSTASWNPNWRASTSYK